MMTQQRTGRQRTSERANRRGIILVAGLFGAMPCNSSWPPGGITAAFLVSAHAFFSATVRNKNDNIVPLTLSAQGATPSTLCARERLGQISGAAHKFNALMRQGETVGHINRGSKNSRAA
jgi:hypothetical protein